MGLKMKLEKSLYQKSYLFFVVFFLFMIWGFWFTYFSKMGEQLNYRLHFHGITLILWCLMLIVQPWLIRLKKVAIHKKIGIVSYVLVPLLLFSTIYLLKYRLLGIKQMSPYSNFAVALVLNALLVFIILYGLAIYHKNKGTIHARYMLCTVFPMIPPITDRIIGTHLPSLLKYLPTLEGYPLVPIYSFAIVDILLLFLCIWDFRSHKRWNVFPFVLLLLVGYHLSVLNFYKFTFWMEFGEWFLAL
ncbi:hypothetical protein [Aquirufa nivalisilvae]|uniref:hypothetical protein n=1 Tax=Aquirufa nivalisilvae TaxID=2516557 RepID=UPI001032A951|nr:hypothetical protein [Aquirufa nivalisilvae]TBH74720.1 hypothetical protein EWU22_06000 [Aquirufa nivalisilvae]